MKVWAVNRLIGMISNITFLDSLSACGMSYFKSELCRVHGSGISDLGV